MSFKNRGLGRGLEALLVDVPANEDRPVEEKSRHTDKVLNDAEVINDAAESVEMANDLLLAIGQERLAILAEAFALKELINEIEQQVRDF